MMPGIVYIDRVRLKYHLFKILQALELSIHDLGPGMGIMAVIALMKDSFWVFFRA